MKKIFSIILAMLMLISVFLMPSLAANEVLTDGKTGLKYEIDYYTTVSQGDCEFTTFGGVRNEKIRGLFNFKTTHFVAPDDPDVRTDVEKLKKEITAWAEKVEPISKVQCDWTLYNGNKANFTYNDDRALVLFFGLSANYKGTKNVQKGEVPFVVTGDGAGNFSVGVSDSVVGRKTANFFAPAFKEFEVYEALSEKFDFSYMSAPDAPIHESKRYETKNFRDGMDFCAKNGDPNEKVDVWESAAVEICVRGTISDDYIINLEYGNDAGKAPAPSNPQLSDKTESSNSGETPKTDEKADTPSKNNSDIQNNNPTNEISDETSEVVLANNNEAQADKDFSANNNIADVEKKSHTGLYIGVAAAVAVIAVGAGTTVVLLKKKNKK